MEEAGSVETAGLIRDEGGAESRCDEVAQDGERLDVEILVRKYVVDAGWEIGAMGGSDPIGYVDNRGPDGLNDLLVKIFGSEYGKDCFNDG